MLLKEYLTDWKTVLAMMLVTAIGASGCVKKRAPDLQSEVERLRQEMESLQKQLAESNARLTEVQGELARRGLTERGEEDPAAAEIPLPDLDSAVTSEELETRPAVAPAPAGAAPAVPSGAKQVPPGTRPAAQPAPQQPKPAPKSVQVAAEQERYYNEAFILYQQKTYAQAIARFEEFTARFPSSSLADNALYWIGECYLDMNQPQQALESFQKLLIRYPTGNKVPDGHLKSGIAHMKLNDVAKAAESFRKVAESYPDSDAARVARDLLARMEEK